MAAGGTCWRSEEGENDLALARLLERIPSCAVGLSLRCDVTGADVTAWQGMSTVLLVWKVGACPYIKL